MREREVVRYAAGYLSWTRGMSRGIVRDALRDTFRDTSPLCTPTSYIYTHPCLSWVGMKCRYESILIEKSSIYFSALPLAKVLERSVPRGVLTLLRVLPHIHVRWGIGGHCPARVADVQLCTWLVWASTRYTSEGRNIDLLGDAIEILEKKIVCVTLNCH